MWWACQFPDPSGTGYRYGASGTLYQETVHRGRFIPLGQERLGDIAVYGPGGDDHAAIVSSRGTVLSNGMEAGPLYEGITAHSGPLAICRLAPFL